MTTYSKRRGRRSLAAILAAMLIASVLAVVAGSPAQAANTSGEYLTAAGAREFAGSDRYQTALKLATRFADDRGGIGSVSNAFIASGESLADAVSVSGLAGFMDAPVLLTRSGALHGAVADFLEDYGIGNLYVLGGETAVSAGVFDALKGLAHGPTVTRISGDTRYDTSAAIASNLSGESWCGTNENSAIVVNGSDDDLFNAVAIGPVANRLELPVLLTAGDDLVDAVISYIESEDVEHAVVVGGEGSVSADVMTALSEAGVDTVERIGGDSAGEVSVAIAGVMGGDCADDLSPVSSNTVALINSDSVIDGIPAAPVLADDTDQLGNGLIPILAVGDSLPASVRDYLAGTSEEVGGNKLHLRILAIGGTAAVSDSVMSAAVSAAASADALTVKIGATTNDADGNPNPLAIGSNTIQLKFSDDITREAVDDLRNRLEDILQINGVPVDIATGAPPTDDAPCDPDSVTVTIERTGGLKAGDTVSIVAGTVLVGADSDRRTVQPASATVPAPTPDRQRPSIRIVAIRGHNAVYGLVSDNTALANTAGTLMAGSINDGNGDPNFEVTAGTAEFASAAPTVSGIEFNTAGSDRKSALLTFALEDDSATADVNEGIVSASDRFRANRGAIEDTAGNESQVTTGVPVTPVSKLQVTNVSIGSVKHSMQAIALIPSAHQSAAAPAVDFARDGRANEAVWLQAKADGKAAGTVGNGWTVRADRASTWDADKDADIDVFVSTKDRRIVVRIVNGEPTFADLKAALEANATVNSLFNVLVDNAYGPDGDDTDSLEDDLCKAANHKLKHGLLPETGTEPDTGDGDDIRTLRGGQTTAAVTVTFNGWVEEISDGESGRLIDHILADATKRRTAANAPATAADMRTALGIADATVLAKPVGDGPKRSVTLNIVTTTDTTNDVDLLAAFALPRPRDIVNVPDGFRKCASADEDTRGCAKDGAYDNDAADGVQRTDPSAGASSIANGYGDNLTGTENDYNYGSKTRIGGSSPTP